MKSFIKIHEDDNVAVALQTVPAGTAVDPDRCSVSALEEIPAGHKIALTDIPEGVFCRGDEAMLQQLAVILLSNALKYSNDGGLIRLSLTQKGRGATITVYNTGEGIAPENLEKIFDRFYREDASHNSAVAGNGLGLAIARTIVQAHKGRIRAESEPGRSATFVVPLP